jgi:hypothetical protein
MFIDVFTMPWVLSGHEFCRTNFGFSFYNALASDSEVFNSSSANGLNGAYKYAQNIEALPV